MLRLAEMTWTEVQGLDLARAVAILPVGATEAHGPHLPLATDVIIAEAMARSGAGRLEARGLLPVLLPAVTYSPADFAAGFPGTVSLGASVVAGVVVDVARSIARAGLGGLAIANAHLDPGHIRAIESAVAAIKADGRLFVAFPDVTRKPWALRLTDEFKSGACHAGQYEGSIVLADRPELVRDAIRRGLAPNPASLSAAIRDGKANFEAAGGPQAYFGDPAAASAEEGRRTIDLLGAILDEAVAEAWSPAEGGAPAPPDRHG